MKFFYACLAPVFLVLAFFYGAGVGKYEWFPHDLIEQIRYDLIKKIKFDGAVKFDKFGRLVYSSDHTKINCPKQTERVGVLVAFGQSNSANHAEFRVPNSQLQGVFNYFNGDCFAAQSPLLGATGSDGEWISLTARKLIDDGVYEKVLVVSTGIGGTSIERWADGNDLNKMMMNVLVDLIEDYHVTDMIWHQGESDRRYTHREVYVTYFKTLVSNIRNTGIDAPIFISIASICGEAKNWKYPNRVSIAQSSLTEIDGIEFGVNTDELVPIELRYDNCHFTKTGQEIAAFELAKSITRFHENE